MGEVQLVENVRAVLKDSVPVKEGSEVWRVRVSYVSDFPSKDRLIKDYYIWVTGLYLEDQAKLLADRKSAEKFALGFAKRRFEESGSKVPKENGAFCSNEGGMIFVDPTEFIHPEEKG